MREFEAGGRRVQSNLEDQVSPKKWVHMEGKPSSRRGEVEKVHAACDARRDPDFVICARTDAIATHGIDEAIRRANLYAEAGADLIFVEAPTTREMIETVAREVSAPITINIALGGKTPDVPWEELGRMGVARVSVGGSYFIGAEAQVRAHRHLLAHGTLAGTDFPMPRAEFYALLGKPEWDARERRYVSREEVATRYARAAGVA